MLGDVVRKALDFYLTKDELKNAALDLHTFGFSHDMHGNFDPQLRVFRDPDHVHVQQLSADGLELPILEHHAGWCSALDFQIENGRVTCLRLDD